MSKDPAIDLAEQRALAINLTRRGFGIMQSLAAKQSKGGSRQAIFDADRFCADVDVVSKQANTHLYQQLVS